MQDNEGGGFMFAAHVLLLEGDESMGLSLERVNLSTTGLKRHPGLPNLQRVHVIHRPQVRKTVEILMRFLPGDFAIDYHAAFEAAGAG